jgi:uncharacterized protein (TIGR02421 family)
MKDLKYKNKILEISLLLNEAQKPIQVLDAVKWGDDIENFFLKTKFKEIPKIDKEFYASRPLKYNPIKKIEEFKEIRKLIAHDFDSTDELAKILNRNALEYEHVVSMLMARGTLEFYRYSKLLYGSPTETLNDGKTKLYELATVLDDILLSIKDNNLGIVHEKNLTSEDVVSELSKRLSPYFADENIKVKLSDGIISDASAGSDYIKIKKGCQFSIRDVHIFEVHEGWVHLGTTLNGQEQSYAKWLSKGPPCSTVTQEGLAVLMELFNFALYPERAQRLNDRLVACTMAEEGANVLEIIEYFRLKGQSEVECISNAGRIFRGAPLNGGSPFTKDISYLKGFIEIYNFLRMTIKSGNADYIPFLFAGKVTLKDVPVLYRYHQEGVINFPKYLPPQIKDLNGLAVWMAFSNFFNKMKIEEIQSHELTKKIKVTA